MAHHDYSALGPNDFNQYDCVKVSKALFILLLFHMRAYLIWLASVSNFKDSSAILSAIYQDHSIFYVDLLTGFVALFLLLVISLRRPDAANWVVKSWRNLRILIIFSTLLQLSGALIAYFYFQQMSGMYCLIINLTSIMLLIGVLKNKRFAINLSEFPQALDKS